MKATLDAVVRSRFPPVAFACGYGSGVFKQAQPTAGKMVDTILVVKDAREWHERNRIQNPTDYAFIPRYVMSASSIERAQREIGGRAWFNTLIPCKHGDATFLMKYGVISLSDFIVDLNEWETMYIAGRLQKPVLELESSEEPRKETSDAIRSAIDKNREYAMKTALALLSKQKSFDSGVLIQEIVGLSYGGDVRVGLAESPTKVKDIAAGSNEELRELYIRSKLGKHLLVTNEDGRMYSSSLTFPELVSGLPGSLREVKDDAELRLQLKDIVRRSSLTQTAKGVLTAGFGKSIKYALSKVGKRFGM